MGGTDIRRRRPNPSELFSQTRGDFSQNTSLKGERTWQLPPHFVKPSVMLGTSSFAIACTRSHQANLADCPRGGGFVNFRVCPELADGTALEWRPALSASRKT